ncbi:MAG: DUF362 domain-containing protein [Thermotogae bacterium]|nr:DUF362 domain-containing protein [Thermotogota bacterium]
MSPGDKILIKPNLLSPVEVTHAVTTHPTVIEALVKCLKDLGVGKIVIGDSPAVSNALKVARKCGIEEISKKFGIDIVNFDTSVKVKGKFGRIFEVAREILEADKIINLAKFKTHTHMIMTLSIKNMFGSVVGLRKSAWHAKTGTNKMKFADMLVELYETIKPTLNIIDGIWGMEGNGPRNGKPKRLGVLLVGEDGHAVDFVACKMVKLEKIVPTLLAAEKRRLLNIKNVDIIGDGFRIIDNFIPPDTSIKGITGIINPFGRFFVKFPKVVLNKCVGCKICKEHCPVGAIDMREDDKARINIDKCIRCYVCQEVCPENAIELIRKGHTRGDKTVTSL